MFWPFVNWFNKVTIDLEHSLPETLFLVSYHYIYQVPLFISPNNTDAKIPTLFYVYVAIETGTSLYGRVHKNPGRYFHFGTNRAGI